jgi:hypothetical protein
LQIPTVNLGGSDFQIGTPDVKLERESCAFEGLGGIQEVRNTLRGLEARQETEP